MTIQEIEQKLNECQKALAYYKMQFELAELKESKKEKWKPKNKEWYWYISPFGSVAQTCWHDSKNECDEYIYSHQPIFKTEEECKRYKRFMDTVKEKSYEFSKEEWDNAHIDKFELNYDGNIGQFRVMCMQNFKAIGGIYFKTKEDAQYIIDNFKEELMEYWL